MGVSEWEESHVKTTQRQDIARFAGVEVKGRVGVGHTHTHAHHATPLESQSKQLPPDTSSATCTPKPDQPNHTTPAHHGTTPLHRTTTSAPTHPTRRGRLEEHSEPYLLSGHQDKSSTDSASASELSIQSDSDHVGIDVVDLLELTVVEQRLNELQLEERGQEIFDLELARPIGIVRFIMLSTVHLNVKCSAHDRCLLILTAETSYEEKYADALTWLKQGIGVTFDAHQEAADEVKVKYGIDVSRSRKRRQEDRGAAAAASAASAAASAADAG